MTTYSHSRLAAFEQCPLKYRLKYIDHVTTGRESIEAFEGKRVHEAIKLLYRKLLTDQVVKLDTLIDHYFEQWEKCWHDGVTVARRNEDEDTYFLHGMNCIENFYKQNFPFQGSRTLHLEHKIEFDLGPGQKYPIQGYVDRVAVRPSGDYEIHDYKTGRRLPTQKAVDADRQMSFYCLGLLSQQPNAKRIDIFVHYLGAGKVFHTKRTSLELVRAAPQARALIDQIETTTEFRARKSPLCDWCEFRPQCPAWQELTWTPHASRAKREFTAHRSHGENSRAHRGRKDFLYYLGRLFRRLLD